GHPSRVSCVVCYYGITDLARLHEDCGKIGFYGPFVKLALESLLGGPPGKTPDRYARASPVTYAGKAAAPLLLIHGTADRVVPHDQSRRLERKLREAGTEVRLLTLKDAPHDFAGEHARRAEAAAREFLDRHLKAAPAGR